MTVQLPIEALVDPVCGLVRELVPVDRHEGMPDRYVAYTAEVADSRRFGVWPSDRVALGTTFGDPEGARIAAIAEAVERYCGNYVPAGLRRASAKELTAAGERHLGPADLPFYADWQFEQPGFPFAPFTEDLQILWTWGEEDGASGCWVPASFVYLNWRQGTRCGEPRLNHLNYAGIATGQGLADAKLRALLEIVERDALNLWWGLGGPARGIRPESVPGLAADLAGSRLCCHLVEMPNEFGVPAVAALVWDPELRIAAAGFAARFDPAEAATKAVLEAVHTWVFTQGLTTADGWVFRAIEAGILGRGLYLDFRADRRYLDDAGPRFERVRDLGAHVQVWLDHRLHPLMRRFSEPAELVDVAAIPSGSEAELYARLAEGGHRVVTVDLTTPDIAETPLRVARVAVSGLIPNAPAAFPYLGYPRWTEAALRRGWRDRPVTPDTFTFAPPPHM
ncbi:YcaO-like family protein [Carbonactinospora thermoautotrophica]|uniref:YcaO-like family protein n=1 Tax=Carbonactinospora thermoautotrophica TaxID=1469144 RepID=UPI002271250F|nr:YcaO-like family protein [Carbonactinospora thermoautotrophica]